MRQITQEEIQRLLITIPFNLTPSQVKISFPIIQRIHRRLQNGHRFDPIKVTADGIITDGHHRYLCLIILEMAIDTIPAAKNHHQTTFQWNQIKVEAQDYDSPEKRIDFELKYD